MRIIWFRAIPLELDTFNEELNLFDNRKFPGYGEIDTGLLKYSLPEKKARFFIILNIC
jgi:hypothetical protein